MEKLREVKAHIHFVGILGSGCYPLACLLHSRGFTVTGSDANAKEESYTDRFGITVTRPQSDVPDGTTLLVYSLAIDEGECEILSARSRGVMLISRAQLLGAIMSLFDVRISVSGSHGKSTTTAAIEHILSSARLDHTAVSGASFRDGSTYIDGGGHIFLAEACEYKDSFLSLCPTHQIITSVELDHTDYFASLDALRDSFLSAARMAQTVIINLDDPIAAEVFEALRRDIQPGECAFIADSSLAKNGELSNTPPTLTTENYKIRAYFGKRLITYGKDPSADYRIHSIAYKGERTEFSLSCNECTLRLSTSLVGEFNLYNLSAAAALAHTLGIGCDIISSAISDFPGVYRRLTQITSIMGVPVYYDYAHHPTEIRAVITALKARYGTLSVIFRPHTYSRTASLWDDFVTALGMADRIVLTDIYPAREEPIEGVDSHRLAECIDGAIYTSDPTRAVELSIGQGIGAIALLGAGDVEVIRAELVRLGQNNVNKN